MKRNALVVLVLVLAPSLPQRRLEAQPVREVTDVRGELLLEQAARAWIVIELRDGSRLAGAAEHLESDRFEIDGRFVAYSSVTAFLDPTTETPIARVRAVRPSQPFQPRQYSTRVVVTVAVAVAAFLLWLRVSVPST